jgi:hypothetical protein
MTDAPLCWRKSTFSGPQADCVEMASDRTGRVLVRNSNHPDAGTLACTPSELRRWLDDLRR